MWVWSLGRENPLERTWQPTPVFLPGESHGQRNLEGYSPWGCRVEHDWSDLVHSVTLANIYLQWPGSLGLQVEFSDSWSSKQEQSGFSRAGPQSWPLPWASGDMVRAIWRGWVCRGHFSPPVLAHTHSSPLLGSCVRGCSHLWHGPLEVTVVGEGLTSPRKFVQGHGEKILGFGDLEWGPEVRSRL